MLRAQAPQRRVNRRGHALGPQAARQVVNRQPDFRGDDHLASRDTGAHGATQNLLAQAVGVGVGGVEGVDSKV